MAVIDSSIAPALALLQQGQAVAVPTETVYGLAADACDSEAVARIFAIKQRPAFNPLIAHYPSYAAISADVQTNPWADALAAAFWPGPLTLVLNKTPHCRLAANVTAGLTTAAVRMPRHPLLLQLLTAFGKPLAAPSANLSGRLSPTRASHVAQQLGEQLAYILDGGPCTIGLESTVVDLSGQQPALLREGGITRAQLEAVIGPLAAADGAIKSPGMLLRHYAPNCPLQVAANTPPPADAVLISFGSQPLPAGYQRVFNLSEKGDLAEAAANLFELLHQAEALNPSLIAVMPIPDEAIGAAIHDRLSRAIAGSLPQA